MIPYLDVILELMIYLVGLLAIVAWLLWAIIWLIGRIFKLLGRYKMLVEAILYLARKRNRRVESEEVGME